MGDNLTHIDGIPIKEYVATTKRLAEVGGMSTLAWDEWIAETWGPNYNHTPSASGESE